MPAPLVVCQARAGSTRLPGKVLKPVVGATLLQRQLERMQAAKTELTLVVATTPLAQDDPIAAVAEAMGLPVFRGHPEDCLDRHFRCAEAFDAEVVVKIPSDCPLIDPGVIDRVLAAFDPTQHDFVSNLHPATYPDGNDVEVMTFEALKAAFDEAEADFERQHTTPFIWERPERFRLANVAWEAGLDYAMSHRFTIDYPEDYAFVCAVYEELWSPERVFSLDDILALLSRRRDIYGLNARYAGVNWYRDHVDELKTVTAEQTRQAPKP